VSSAIFYAEHKILHCNDTPEDEKKERRDRNYTFVEGLLTTQPRWQQQLWGDCQTPRTYLYYLFEFHVEALMFAAASYSSVWHLFLSFAYSDHESHDKGDEDGEREQCDI
jgi:hypothetical protein